VLAPILSDRAFRPPAVLARDSTPSVCEDPLFLAKDITMPLSAGRVSARWARFAQFALCCFVIVFVFSFFSNPPAARAQDAGDAELKQTDQPQEKPAIRPDTLFLHMIKSVGPV